MIAEKYMRSRWCKFGPDLNFKIKIVLKPVAEGDNGISENGTPPNGSLTCRDAGQMVTFLRLLTSGYRSLKYSVKDNYANFKINTCMLSFSAKHVWIFDGSC